MPAFEQSGEEIVRRFTQWEQSVKRSPNPAVNSVSLTPPTLAEADAMLPRLRELREKIEIDLVGAMGEELERDRPDLYDKEAMGWLWMEWREDRGATGYKEVWKDRETLFYDGPRHY